MIWESTHYVDAKPGYVTLMLGSVMILSPTMTLSAFTKHSLFLAWLGTFVTANIRFKKN